MKLAELDNAFMFEVEPPVADCADLSFDPHIALHCFLMNGGASQAFTFRKKGFALTDESTGQSMRESFQDFAHSYAPIMGVTEYDAALYQVPGMATEDSVVVRSLFNLIDNSENL